MIPILFNILFFVIPLIYFKNTSELFEFNKIVAIYTFTALIVSAWAIQSIRIKKFIFRKTLLDWPLIIYLSIYLISSLFSIDPRTSWLGYYSRFNGGLISQICYSLLYWAFVSHMSAKQSLYAIRYSLISTAIASVLAVLEHFGTFVTCSPIRYSIIQQPENIVELNRFNLLNISQKFQYLFQNNCWVQDIQSRVFSTLGQPNWLAATITALIPMTWYFAITNFKLQISNSKQYTTYNIQYTKILSFLVSMLFFVTLLFTKSRSGLLAFGIESILFWGLVFWKEKFKYLKEFLILFFVSIILVFFVNQKLVSNPSSLISTPQGNSLETGGTESGTIRKYVWLGAIEVFKHYPILGTGPETFAFSFPMYKPAEHNLTSEWNFIYNKAHNEFLNALSNTGILGFISYIFLIGTVIKLSIQKLTITNNLEFRIYNLALICGYIAILITNFFGFSVVPISLLFFLFPAVAIASSAEGTTFSYDARKTNFNQKLLMILVLLTTLYTLYAIRLYWLADIYYNTGKLEKALIISPNEPNYVAKFAQANNSKESALKAFNLNQYNQNSRRVLINNLAKSAGDNPNNLLIAEEIILAGIHKSPNDAQLFYQLGVIQIKLGKYDDAINSLQKSIELKSNYKEARFTLAAIHIDSGEFPKAKEQLEYIIENIDPKDDLTKKYLDEINSSSLD